MRAGHAVNQASALSGARGRVAMERSLRGSSSEPGATAGLLARARGRLVESPAHLGSGVRQLPLASFLEGPRRDGLDLRSERDARAQARSRPGRGNPHELSAQQVARARHELVADRAVHAVGYVEDLHLPVERRDVEQEGGTLAQAPGPPRRRACLVGKRLDVPQHHLLVPELRTAAAGSRGERLELLDQGFRGGRGLYWGAPADPPGVLCVRALLEQRLEPVQSGRQLTLEERALRSFHFPRAVSRFVKRRSIVRGGWPRRLAGGGGGRCRGNRRRRRRGGGGTRGGWARDRIGCGRGVGLHLRRNVAVQPRSEQANAKQGEAQRQGADGRSAHDQRPCGLGAAAWCTRSEAALTERSSTSKSSVELGAIFSPDFLLLLPPIPIPRSP